ncbi:MAG: RIP metalloprotease RseP [Deltaproteobacteria bacterium]|nr:MAG: RIP metalloprotease RseP [Deltaproteobacteria bacterium]
MNTVISFVLTLGVLIFFHEFGHFFFAKLFGVKVLRFSLGFGPKLVGRQVGETEYVISALPLGGYVKMVGQGADEFEVAPEDQHCAFVHKPVWQRFLIVLAGPLFNLLLPVIIFFMIFSFVGVPKGIDNTTIGKVVPKSASEKAGLKQGDEIIAIDGQPVRFWLDVLDTVKNCGGKELVFTVVRDGAELDIAVTPREEADRNALGEETGRRYMVGIIKAELLEYHKISLFEAAKKSIMQTWLYVYLIGMSLVKLFQQAVPASELGGPILIAQMAGEQLKAGWMHLLYFMSFLSVNLGLLNLLPIPVLDGGHLVFLSYEALRRKPMSERVQLVSQQVGIAFLLLLMVFAFYNDLTRLFQ